MGRYTLLMGLSQDRTMRLLMAQGQNQLLKAILPRPPEGAAAQLLAALSLWMRERVSAVLSVADRDGLSGFAQLHDGFGFGVSTDEYKTKIDIRAERLRGTRLLGFGDFGELRRLGGRGGLS